MKSKLNQKVAPMTTAFGRPSRQGGRHRQVAQVNGTLTAKSVVESAIEPHNNLASISDAELEEFFCSEAGAGMVEKIMSMTTRFVEIQNELLKRINALNSRINEQVERGVQPRLAPA